MSSQAIEDCRDYLRTGRCKYGPSCKYRHPPNVQNGGGIKTPLNPAEPPFPIRPTEPSCQYYLKHGTCKFGQACKFNHPPQSGVTTAVVSGGCPPATSYVVSNGEYPNVQRQLIVDGNEMLQFLPQRPGEPNCIYFLRNGRCKYGATCRYHHPVHQVVTGEVGRIPQHSSLSMNNHGSHRVPVIDKPRSMSFGSAADTYPNLQQRHQISLGTGKGGPTHILVSDGPISVVTLNNPASSSEQSTHRQNDSPDVTYPYSTQTSAAPLISSSTNHHDRPASNVSSPLMASSSVASSYETALSSFDFLVPSQSAPPHTDTQMPHWSRAGHQHMPNLGTGINQGPPKLGSNRTAHTGNETQAFLPSGIDRNHVGTVRWKSDADSATTHMVPKRYRTLSAGSLSEGLAYPNNTPTEKQPWQTQSTTIPSLYWDNGLQHRDSGLSSTDSESGRQRHHSAERTVDYNSNKMIGGAELKSSASKPKQARGSIRNAAFDDEGMSQMTSALLNMMDISEAPSSFQTKDGAPSPSTPRRGTTTGRKHNETPSHFVLTESALEVKNGPIASRKISKNVGNSLSNNHTINRRAGNPSAVSRLKVLQNTEAEASTNGIHSSRDSWSPTWPSLGQQMEQSAQNVSVIQTPQRPATGNAPVGLFLP